MGVAVEENDISPIWRLFSELARERIIPVIMFFMSVRILVVVDSDESNANTISDGTKQSTE